MWPAPNHQPTWKPPPPPTHLKVATGLCKADNTLVCVCFYGELTSVI